MSDKKITYQVNRSMQGGGESFERGDTRELTAAEAAPLVQSGALSLPGEDPATRPPAVQHLFGAAPQHSRKGFTVANPDRAIKLPERGAAAKKAAAEKAAAEKAAAEQAAAERAAAERAAAEQAAAEQAAAEQAG